MNYDESSTIENFLSRVSFHGGSRWDLNHTNFIFYIEESNWNATFFSKLERMEPNFVRLLLHDCILERQLGSIDPHNFKHLNYLSPKICCKQVDIFEPNLVSI